MSARGALARVDRAQALSIKLRAVDASVDRHKIERMEAAVGALRRAADAFVERSIAIGRDDRHVADRRLRRNRG